MRRGAQRGFACDIKEGPLQAAKRNLDKAGFAERVQPVLTDGLAGMEQSGVTDVVIAGIGGEVISGILERAPFLQQEGIRLVLQPQTREQVLRDFLANNGFAVIEEEVVSSGNYLYVFMVAVYTPHEKILERSGQALRQIKAVGYFLPTEMGIRYDIQGHWERGKHGDQYAVTQFAEVIQPTEAGIIAYLSSGYI